MVTLWRRSVEATHDFLRHEDLEQIHSEVEQFLPRAQLVLAVDAADRPMGMMLVADGNMDLLFIDPDHRGKGVGRILVEHALRDNPALCTDVNESNRQAAGFYRRMGFVESGRSPVDGKGRPYPMIHLRYEGGKC